jgi:lipopolysaccharide export system ATP-binding protein
MAVLRAEALTKSFGSRVVVSDLTLEVRSGEIVGLLGRNGAGKTTTFQMMAGLLRPDSGRLFLDDFDLSRLATDKRARRGVTYLPQEGSAFLKATVGDNLRMILELRRLTRPEREERARALLEELGLTDLADQPAHTLSGGERRRLEICRALVLDPSFLLLDEPFTGIDPLTIVEIQKILLRLRERGIGIVLTDHNVRDTFRIVGRAAIIDEGRVLIEGPPEALAADERARRRFLGPDFRLGGEVLRGLA